MVLFAVLDAAVPVNGAEFQVSAELQFPDLKLPGYVAALIPAEAHSKQNTIKNPIRSFSGFSVEVLLCLVFECFCFMMFFCYFQKRFFNISRKTGPPKFKKWVRSVYSISNIT
jgi:hypothetical protein